MTPPRKSEIPYKVVPYKAVGFDIYLLIMQPSRPLQLNSNIAVQFESEIITYIEF